MHGTFETNAQTARPQAFRLLEIKRNYAAHRRDQKQRRINPATRMAWLRLSELERLFGHRYGRTLPDDDAGRDDLALALHHIAGAKIDVAHRCVVWAKLWAPWMSAKEVGALGEQVATNLQHFKAATLGRRLRLTETERIHLKIRTIRAFDATEDPAQRKRRLDRERKARKRAEARAARPESVSRTKPWEAEGVSRRTWYRRKATRRRCGTRRGTKPVASISTGNTGDAFSAIARGSTAKRSSMKVHADRSRYPNRHINMGSG